MSQAGRVPALKHVIVLPQEAWQKPATDKIDFAKAPALNIVSIEEVERKV
jgi:hypothetical protein